MADYYVLLEGEGTGCNYTVDCNKTWRKLRADGLAHAYTEVGTIIDTYSEPAIETAIILEVIRTENFNVANWRRMKAHEQEVEAQAEALEKRREEYERLKAEFGD